MSESYTHTTAHTEVDGFRCDPVNLDRYIPLWRRGSPMSAYMGQGRY